MFLEPQEKINDVDKGENKKRYALKQIAELIKNGPIYVAGALDHSSVFIENPYDKRELVDKVAYNLVHNPQFQQDINVVLAAKELGRLDILSGDYSNLGGKGKVDVKGQVKETGKMIGKATQAGTQVGGWIGAIVGAVVGVISSSFSWAGAKKRAKIEEEQYKQDLVKEVFEPPKRNWTPILVVGGVLIVAAVVTLYALKEE